MRPKKNTQGNNKTTVNHAQDSLAAKFPGLAIPNEPQKTMTPEVETKPNEDDDVVADLMAQLEADAPSQVKIEEKVKRERSSSGERRSRHRKSEVRHRDRERERDRDRDRDRERDRDRYRDRKRHRSRSKDRSDKRRRSRSRSRRRRSRSRSYSPKRRDKVKIKRESPELDEDPIPGKVSPEFNFTFHVLTFLIDLHRKSGQHRPVRLLRPTRRFAPPLGRPGAQLPTPCRRPRHQPLRSSLPRHESQNKSPLGNRAESLPFNERRLPNHR